MSATDFALQFDFKPVVIPETGDMSVTFRGTGDSSCYTFSVSPIDGNWYFGRKWKGEWQEVQGDFIPSMRVGQAMRVLLLARGEGMAVFLDGRPVSYMMDASIRGDANYLGAWSDQGANVVDVDNVKFWDLNNLLP
jgi:hypothetical protein